MKSTIKKMLGFVFLSLILSSCYVDDYLEDRSFSVEIEEYSPEIKKGETIGIKCRIVPDHKLSYVHYFYMYDQKNGSGTLENSRRNKVHEYSSQYFSGEEFMVYYTAKTDRTQKFVLTVYNNYGGKERVEINLN